MDYKFLYVLLMAVVFFGIRITCVLFAYRIQLRAKRWVSMGISGRIPALQRYLSSRAYLLHTRAVGIVALLAFVLFALAAIKSS